VDRGINFWEEHKEGAVYPSKIDGVIKKGREHTKDVLGNRCQKVAKKDGPKPSGPGLESLFIVVSAFFISSGVKGALRLPGKGEVLG
jgi:hypothetical protein